MLMFYFLDPKQMVFHQNTTKQMNIRVLFDNGAIMMARHGVNVNYSELFLFSSSNEDIIEVTEIGELILKDNFHKQVNISVILRNKFFLLKIYWKCQNNLPDWFKIILFSSGKKLFRFSKFYNKLLYTKKL